MKRSLLIGAATLVALGSYALGASTQRPLVQTYDKIADGILAAKQSEKAIVAAILLSHRQAASAAAAAGRWDDAAAEMALWANEGDNAVGGIRKRLLEGGHHHNAEGEAKGIFEAGYVTVTVEMKRTVLTMVAVLQEAKDDAGRRAPFKAFEELADSVSPSK